MVDEAFHVQITLVVGAVVIEYFTADFLVIQFVMRIDPIDDCGDL